MVLCNVLRSVTYCCCSHVIIIRLFNVFSSITETLLPYTCDITFYRKGPYSQNDSVCFVVKPLCVCVCALLLSLFPSHFSTTLLPRTTCTPTEKRTQFTSKHKPLHKTKHKPHLPARELRGGHFSHMGVLAASSRARRMHTGNVVSQLGCTR
jgi:hypothetical protein